MAGSPGGKDKHRPSPGPGSPAARVLAHTLTKSLRCRAQTRPSPPLFPGPQMTRTAGGLRDMDLGG